MRSLAALALLLPAAAAPEELFVFNDREINESSGLVVVGDRVVTVNDSGDSGRLFTVDPTNGQTVGVTSWEPFPRDVEALAPATRGQVWVGDIGDNQASRDAVQVFRVPVGDSGSVEPETFALTYPDGPRDAESLLAEPGSGRLHVVSKGVLGGTLYAAPQHLDADRPNRLEPLGTVLGIATDAAFFPDGKHLVVRDYRRAVVYTYPELEAVGSVVLPDQEQGEAIAVDDRDRLLISSEGPQQPVFRVELPADVRRAMAGPEPTVGPPATPTGPESPAPTARSSPEPDPSTEPGPAARPVWPWVFGWVVLGVIVVVLLRSLRPPAK